MSSPGDGWRSSRRHGDSGSLPLALLLTTVGPGLSVVLAMIMATQIRGTGVDLQRVEALNAATSGISATLSSFQSAVTSDGKGARSLLPCGPIAGAVSGGSAASYTVAIHYLTGKPAGGDLAYAAANRLSCTPGSGPATMPGYALLHSTGTVRAGGMKRVLMATYTFQTLSNGNIVGGLIRAYGRSGGQQLCMAAENAPAAGGVRLVTRACDRTDPLQIFSYEKNLNLVLVSSRTPARPGGMCVDGGTTPTDLTPVTLQACSATTVPRQQWGHNDFAAFQGTSNGVDFNDFCLNMSTPGSTSDIVLGDRTKHPATGAAASCDGDVYSANKTFFPDPTVGTGAAGPQTKQLVNDDQFGRCVDVTGNRVATPFLVVFPCKQSPDGVVLWNQQWTVPGDPERRHPKRQRTHLHRLHGDPTRSRRERRQVLLPHQSRLDGAVPVRQPHRRHPLDDHGVEHDVDPATRDGIVGHQLPHRVHLRRSHRERLPPHPDGPFRTVA